MELAIGEIPDTAMGRMGVQGSFGAKGAPQDDNRFLVGRVPTQRRFVDR